MPEKILYILGAGASVKALPLAKTIWKEENVPSITGLAYALKKSETSGYYNSLKNKNLNPLLIATKERFIKLGEKADEFGDVDTYAKYLNLINPGSNELRELKRTLSEFFVLQQLLMNARDSRYLPWLVSIMNKRVFPENVKVLNWNYDFQVELAASQLGEPENIEVESNSFVYSPSTFLHYPNLDPTFSDYNLLSLIHLNGIAGFSKQQEFKSASAFQKRYSDIDSLLNFMQESRDTSQLYFAWEKSQYQTDLMEHVKSMIQDTTILVVIGYSFPFFNREVDKEIFNEITNMESFRKIYYQDPVLTGQQLKAQFSLDPDLEITHIKATDNFHIPFEY